MIAKISKIIRKILGIEDMEDWSNRDSIEFSSVHGDETCKECGAEADNEYCQRCAPHMESE